MGAFFAMRKIQMSQGQKENRARFLPLIHQTEVINGIPAGMLDALLYQESRYRSDIINCELVSGAGAKGIAQIVPRWHPTAEPCFPEKAIKYAGSYLRDLFDRFGNWSLALAAYNWGPTALSEHLKENGGALVLSELPRETADYIAGINSNVGRIG